MSEIEKKTLELTFGDQKVRVHGDLVSLTDMWRANGSHDGQRPARWREHESTRAFVAFLEETAIAKNVSECFRVVRNGAELSTWAHWQIAMSYAKYLSPAFHAWCNEVVRAHMQAAAPLVTRTEALRLALAASERADALEAKVRELAPKAEALDQLEDAKSTFGIDQLAKMLGTGEIRMFRWLRENGILLPSNEPYQQHLEAGRFRLVERRFKKPNGELHLRTRSLVTGKGAAYIARRYVAQHADAILALPANDQLKEQA